MLDSVSCMFLCVCTVGSCYSTSLLTSVLLLQIEMILRDCIKCIGQKWCLNVTFRNPCMCDRFALLPGEATFLAFALNPALNFKNKMWVICYFLYLAEFGAWV